MKQIQSYREGGDLLEWGRRFTDAFNDSQTLEDWTEIGTTGAPAFLNSWVNYNAAIDETAAFYIDHLGIVNLKGRVKSGTVPGAIYTLPTGYRPNLKITLPVVSNGVFGYIYISTSGDVVAQSGSNTYFNLDGIQFRVDI